MSTAFATASAAVKAGRFSVKIRDIDPKTSAEVQDYDVQTAAGGTAGRPLVDAKAIMS